MRFPKFRLILLAVSAVALMTAAAAAAEFTASLKPGKADLKSAGALAFGPEGILFVGDTAGAAIFALDTEDRKPSSAGTVDIKEINKKVAAALGTAADQILINDMVVNPISKKVYLSVSRGRGPDATPVILQVDQSGKIQELSLDSVRASKVNLPNAPGADAKDRRGRPLMLQAITDLAFVDGKVFVAGLSNEEFASNLRSIAFPFTSADGGTSVEIYHGNHGRWETRSPIRTFVPYEIKSEAHLLAAYTCTPLVMFPISNLKAGTKIVGTTIAELGNRNRPLDMIVYKNGSIDYILMSNSSRGVMKLSTEKLGSFEAITERVGGTKGVPYETVAELTGVQQLDSWDDHNAIILVQHEGGSMDLKTVPLP